MRKHQEWFRGGYGTENVGFFLQSLMQMVRPERVLELGGGYTTPFLIEAIANNSKLYTDTNYDSEYLKNASVPKMVVIDEDFNVGGKVNDIDYVEVIEGRFQGQSKYLYDKYGKFDFVWFDCGGVADYKDFIKEYWDICSEYVIFHFTYYEKQPNKVLETILKNIRGSYFRMDIIEPHKFRQGSLTMLRKAHVPRVGLFGDSFHQGPYYSIEEQEGGTPKVS